MRQWHVPPRAMCDQHLLGEHVEHHMFVGSLLKGISLEGYIEGGLLETATLRQRHDDLVAEMESRGMAHRSPLPAFPDPEPRGFVDPEANLAEMARRCPACARWQRLLL